MDYLVRFLKNEANIPNSNYISTRAVLIPLITYLDMKNIKLTREEKNSLLKWMYSALMWSRYGSSTDTKLEKDISLLDIKKPTKDLMEEIKDERGRIKVQPSDLDGRGKRSKRFYNMVKIITRANNPIDWITGEPLKGNYNLESHHIFPKSKLYDELYDSSNHMGKKRVNEISNRTFLTPRGNKELSDKLPKNYLPKVRKKDSKALKKQFLPENKELWKLENYEEFLAKRREILARAINDFLESFGTPKREEKENIKELIRKGENQRIEFKETLKYDVKEDEKNNHLKSRIAKEACAFANSDGGTILIGVDDNKNIKGIKRDLNLLKKGKDSFEVELNQEISNKLDKSFASIYTQINFREVNGKEICVVSVESSPEPIYYKEEEFYVRNGSSSMPLTMREARNYIKEHWN